MEQMEVIRLAYMSKLTLLPPDQFSCVVQYYKSVELLLYIQCTVAELLHIELLSIKCM